MLEHMYYECIQKHIKQWAVTEAGHWSQECHSKDIGLEDDSAHL